MSKQVYVKLNRSAVGKELLNAKEIQDYVSSKANEIANRCGDGYEAQNVKMSERTIAIVSTKTPKAMADCKKTNRLLKELHE